MRLLRLKADGFGLLRGEYVFDPSRLNLVIDENERGKTSLLHAIVAGLYGLERDGRRYRSLLTPLERWRPWDGGTFRVELEIESEGETYTIVRDFARGTTEIWNDRGQDVTPDFQTDKDDYHVGQQLLGLDAEEFTKCAFWRQGELAEVVPEQERDRRLSTLRARLESAADTRAGDASASEAIQALDLALARFSSPELGTVITVDNAVRRLEGMRDAAEVELRGLEGRYAGIAAPLDEIARLGEEERSLRDRLAALDAWRMRLRARDAAERLGRDAERRAAIERLRAEAETLTPLAGVPPDAETTLAAQAAKHGSLGRRLEELRAERQATERELATMDEHLAAFASCARCTLEDADRLAALFGELVRLDEELGPARANLDAGITSLRAHGIDPERAVALLARFDAMTVEQGDLLREQPRLALAHQAEMAAAEQTRVVARSTLRDIARWKRPRYVGAAALIGLGLASAALALLASLDVPAWALLAGSAAGSIAGIATWVATARARRLARNEALERIANADEALRQGGLRAAENKTRLQSLASEVGYGSTAAMFDDWGEDQRLRDLHAPVQAAEQHLSGLERQRARILDAAEPLLRRAGGGKPTPEALEEAAGRIRRRIDLWSQRTTVARALERADSDIGSHEAEAADLEREATGTIASAGLTYEPGGSWSAWLAEVAGQVRRAARHRALVSGEIPALERELLDRAARATLTAESEAPGAHGPDVDAAPVDLAGPAPATATEAEARMREAREALDRIRDAREKKRREVQSVADAYHADHPDLVTRLEVVTRELERAGDFRDAVMLAKATIERVARETHRRWAEFMNHRVGELLADVGTGISRVRFGEDLDFSLTPARGTPTSRLKAVHQLSTGARDQVHLAVRLAISEFLSRGRESLPLLIDDCFATSDDERTRAGMRLLLDAFSRQHQIVLVTCHRLRYEALAEQDRALWADRAHWLELRAGVAAAI